MWGKSFVRPAVGLRLIFEINFKNTAGVRRTKSGVEIVTAAVLNFRTNWVWNEMWGGAKQEKKINFFSSLSFFLSPSLRFYNTAGVTRMKCGVKFVRPAVGLRQILTILWIQRV
jgi:hypothetical protein